MIVDMEGIEIFKEKNLKLDKKVNFIYGKNSTGKSTFTELIINQNADCDVCVFNGFEGTIGENKKLNAVVLGKENKKIEEDIKELRLEIITNEEEIKRINLNICEPEEKEQKNLWTEWNEKKQLQEKLEKGLDDFFKHSASELKNKNNPQIAPPIYDKRLYKEDIMNAALLDDTTILKLEDVLRSTVKTAQEIIFPELNSIVLLKEVNAILSKKVTKRTGIIRLDNQDKINFANEGRKIHKVGDFCAFCGNIISNEVFEELENYFSADEITNFQNEISMKKSDIESIKTNIDSLDISEVDFYSTFEEQIIHLHEKIKDLKERQISFCNELINALSNKSAELFVSSKGLFIETPETFDNIKKEYDALRFENNKNDLKHQQEMARKKLKYHYIKRQLDEFEYYIKEQEIKDIKDQVIEIEEKINQEKEKITGEGGLEEKINSIKEKINMLIAETRNEKILANNINKKLKHMVSFELVSQKSEDGEGYYAIKSLIDGSIRNVEKLSTGEKNIIAFLYFIEKLNEFKTEIPAANMRIIVFDDPMNSNDDNMQYLIMSELIGLINSIKNKKIYFILLTHNKHFYVNLTYEKDYKKKGYFRFETDGMHTSIIKIDGNNDFKTSYASLWHELRFLYNSTDVPAEMLLNPIRRIIETFYKFNNIKDFYAGLPEAKKLFNVNSHSIDDLEAELNGKTKEQIRQLMKDCFVNNNAESHFTSYWP